MRPHLWSASFMLLLAGSVAGCVDAQDQSSSQPANKSGLSAREVFYEVDQTTAVTPGKPTAAAPAIKNQPRPKARHVPKPEASVASNTPHVNAPPSVDERPAPSSSSSDGAGQVALASLSDKRYPPLGLRYAVYRLTGDGQRAPIDSSTVFHSNDHLQCTVEVNAPGYLYIVTRGASGKWSTLFPEAGDSAGAAEIKPRQVYTIPPGGQITFTEPAGQERLFLFLSRQPVRSTEDLMLEMSNGGKPEPASQPEAAPRFRHDNTIEAFNRMDDARIADLNRVYSRDLIVEKVNDETAASKPVPQAPEKDTSVYVVDPSGKANSHVVADIVLRHE